MSTMYSYYCLWLESPSSPSLSLDQWRPLQTCIFLLQLPSNWKGTKHGPQMLLFSLSLSLSLSLLTHLLNMKKSVKDDTDWLKRWLTVIHCVVVTQQQRAVHKAMTQNYWISLDQQLICFYPEYLPQCNVKSYRGSSICSWILTRSEFKWRYAFSILQMKNSVCARMKTAAHIAESHSSLCLSSSLSALNLAAFLPSRLVVLLAITLVSHYTEATAA